MAKRRASLSPPAPSPLASPAPTAPNPTPTAAVVRLILELQRTRLRVQPLLRSLAAGAKPEADPELAEARVLFEHAAALATRVVDAISQATSVLPAIRRQYRGQRDAIRVGGCVAPTFHEAAVLIASRFLCAYAATCEPNGGDLGRAVRTLGRIQRDGQPYPTPTPHVANTLWERLELGDTRELAALVQIEGASLEAVELDPARPAAATDPDPEPEPILILLSRPQCRINGQVFSIAPSSWDVLRELARRSCASRRDLRTTCGDDANKNLKRAKVRLDSMGFPGVITMAGRKDGGGYRARVELERVAAQAVPAGDEAPRLK